MLGAKVIRLRAAFTSATNLAAVVAPPQPGVTS
jgi:hypothetical protein